LALFCGGAERARARGTDPLALFLGRTRGTDPLALFWRTKGTGPLVLFEAVEGTVPVDFQFEFTINQRFEI
jgi:hypothetical protein